MKRDYSLISSQCCCCCCCISENVSSNVRTLCECISGVAPCSASEQESTESRWESRRVKEGGNRRYLGKSIHSMPFLTLLSLGSERHGAHGIDFCHRSAAITIAGNCRFSYEQIIALSLQRLRQRRFECWDVVPTFDVANTVVIWKYWQWATSCPPSRRVTYNAFLHLPSYVCVFACDLKRIFWDIQVDKRG